MKLMYSAGLLASSLSAFLASVCSAWVVASKFTPVLFLGRGKYVFSTASMPASEHDAVIKLNVVSRETRPNVKDLTKLCAKHQSNNLLLRLHIQTIYSLLERTGFLGEDSVVLKKGILWIYREPSGCKKGVHVDCPIILHSLQ